jgi:hypothetical protein
MEHDRVRRSTVVTATIPAVLRQVPLDIGGISSEAAGGKR